MATDTRFFRSAPDASINWPQATPEPGTNPGVVLVLLERHNDPDATNHIGFDFYGAHGIGDEIDGWAKGQPLQAIERDQMPAALTYCPAPFSEI